MRSFATEGFWRALEHLSPSARRQARDAFRLFERDPFHPSLHFKRVDLKPGVWSVRVSIGYRALGIRARSQIRWFWIGSHADYDKLV